MSLIKCSECNNELSDKAETCPHCGCPVSKMEVKKEEKKEIKKPKKEITVLNEERNGMLLFISFLISFTIFILVVGDINFVQNIKRSIPFFQLRHYFNDLIVTVSFVYCLSILFGYCFRFLKKVFYEIISIVFYVIGNLALCDLGFELMHEHCKLLNIFIVLLVLNIILVLIPSKRIVKVNKEEVSDEDTKNVELSNNELIKKNKKMFIVRIVSAIIMSIASIFTITQVCNDNHLDKIEENKVNPSIVTSMNQIDSENEYLYVKIKNDYINVRKQNTTSSDKIGKVNKYELYLVQDIKKSDNYYWYLIQDSEGNIGYIASQKNNPFVETSIEDKNVGILSISTISDYKSSGSTTTTTVTTTKYYDYDRTTKKTTTKKGTTTSRTTTVVKTTTASRTTIVSDGSIAATSRTGCFGDYTKSGDKCVLIHYDYTKYTSSCPEGYSRSGTSCSGKTEVINATQTVSCSAGKQYLTYVSGYAQCRKGSLVSDHVCPSGYSLSSVSVGGMTSCKCTRTPKASLIESCTDSAYHVDKSKHTCYTRVERDPWTEYSCPSGYKLSGTKCYKN